MSDISSGAAVKNNGYVTDFKGRASFFLTDFCGNLLFCIIGSYLLYFYTDVFGLPVTVTGILLLLTRILDAMVGNTFCPFHVVDLYHSIFLIRDR